MSCSAPRQLQKKFKHAAEFAVPGKYSPGNAARFEAALRAHVHAATTEVLPGMFRGKPATHYLNSATRLNIVVDGAGNFMSGWRLSPAQLREVLASGRLR